MHARLQAIIDEFQSASDRLHHLAEVVPTSRWAHRADPNRWSVAECVAHLNLTAEVYLPLLRQGLEDGRQQKDAARVRYRFDPVGWLLWRTMGPPVRMRVRTAAKFVPDAAAPKDDLIRTFERLQAEQMDCVRAAEGLPLQKIWIQSPFDARAKYNLYAALRILPRHQHRHLWQAEQVHGTEPIHG